MSALDFHVFVIDRSTRLEQVRNFVIESRVVRMCSGYAIGAEVGPRWCRRLNDSLSLLVAEARASGRNLVTYVTPSRHLALTFHDPRQH